MKNCFKDRTQSKTRVEGTRAHVKLSTEPRVPCRPWGDAALFVNVIFVRLGSGDPKCAR